MAGGQSDDIQGLSADSSIEDLESLHRSKTGALIEACLRMGGAIAEASDDQVHALVEYGWRVGLAFQIIDDILDEEGDEEEIGKPVGSDLDLGKVTFVSLLGVDDSWKKAEQLIVEAKEQLGVFDDASSLVALAGYVLERQK